MDKEAEEKDVVEEETSEKKTGTGHIPGNYSDDCMPEQEKSGEFGDIFEEIMQDAIKAKSKPNTIFAVVVSLLVIYDMLHLIRGAFSGTDLLFNVIILGAAYIIINRMHKK